VGEQRDEGAALQCVAVTQQGAVVDLDAALAVYTAAFSQAASLTAAWLTQPGIAARSTMQAYSASRAILIWNFIILNPETERADPRQAGKSGIGNCVPPPRYLLMYVAFAALRAGATKPVVCIRRSELAVFDGGSNGSFNCPPDSQQSSAKLSGRC
jgi:hypothetical protein